MQSRNRSVVPTFQDQRDGLDRKTARRGTGFAGFLREDSGAVTIDWVTLTAGILVAGMMAVFAIFGSGVSALTANVNADLTNLTSDLDPGTVVQQNP